MEILWSPWRTKYIDTFKDEKEAEKCFICLAIENPDKDNEFLVVERREHCIAMLNKFPYNSGHLLIAPKRHIGELEDLSLEELTEMMQLVKDSLQVIRKDCNPHGFNVGMNLGRVAGAGLPDHLHIHIVPRWNGDTSFVSVISDIKVVSKAIEETQKSYAELFKQLFNS